MKFYCSCQHGGYGFVGMLLTRQGCRLSVTRKKETLGFGSQKPLRLMRDGEVGGREFLYLTPTRYTVTTKMLLH